MSTPKKHKKITNSSILSRCFPFYNENTLLSGVLEMITTLPRLTFSGYRTQFGAPNTFGELRRSDDAFEDTETLRARMSDDGYLYLPGYLDREEVLAARHTMLQRLAEEGRSIQNAPLDEGRINPDVHMQFRADLALDNHSAAKGAVRRRHDAILESVLR
jgi:hypothetical protein